MGAAFHPYLKSIDVLDAWQPFYPLAAQLEMNGIPNPAQLASGKRYTLALVQIPKQVDEAKFWIATALESLASGGHVLACAANDAGGGRIEGWFKEAGLEPQSYSKNKCRAVWAERPEILSGNVKDWYDAGIPRMVDMEAGLPLMSQPGLFSWDRIDAGSRLLAAHIPPDLKGVGADFGCGIGYLTHAALRGCPAISSMHCLDADMRALSCAATNLGSDGKSFSFYWKDLSQPVPELPPLDFILMNPPFHEGKKTDIALGCAFVQNAAAALKKGGQLLMVANRQLPYEEPLQKSFTNVRMICDKDGFKILKAVK